MNRILLLFTVALLAITAKAQNRQHVGLISSDSLKLVEILESEGSVETRSWCSCLQSDFD